MVLTDIIKHFEKVIPIKIIFNSVTKRYQRWKTFFSHHINLTIQERFQKAIWS